MSASAPAGVSVLLLLYVCMDIALRNTFLVEDLLNKESESESDHLVVRLDEVWTLLYLSRPPPPTTPPRQTQTSWKLGPF